MIPILSGIIVGPGPPHQPWPDACCFRSSTFWVWRSPTRSPASPPACRGRCCPTRCRTPGCSARFAVRVRRARAVHVRFLRPAAAGGAAEQAVGRDQPHARAAPSGACWHMGVLSALIVGPCVAAPLAGALLYINQTRDAVLGGTALFAMALGMGVPLLAVGAVGRHVAAAGRRLDADRQELLRRGAARAGDLDRVAGDPSAAVHMLLWAGLLIVLGDLSACPRSAAAQRLRLSEAVEGGGRHRAAGGGGPAGRRACPAAAISSSRWPACGHGGSGARRRQAASRFVQRDARWRSWSRSWRRPAGAGDARLLCRLVRLLQGDGALHLHRPQRAGAHGAHAPAQGRRHRELAEDTALLKRFGLFGPPGTIFFDPAGKELTPARDRLPAGRAVRRRLWTQPCSRLMSRAGQIALFARGCRCSAGRWGSCSIPGPDRAGETPPAGAAAASLMQAALPDLTGQPQPLRPMDAARFWS